MALLPSITPAAVPVRIKFDMFFDRAGVAAGISRAKKMGLWRAGSVVMQNARRSIEKRGMARPKLKEQRSTSSEAMREVLRSREKMVSTVYSKRARKKDERALQQARERMFEMRFRTPSAPGNPPYTHGAQAQLRRSITYGYDAATESVVVGGFMKGIERLVSLHEFGGSQKMAPWAWVPDNDGNGYRGIIGWWAVGRRPKSKRWKLMQRMKPNRFIYPKRPYMQPALEKGVASGRIVAQFANSVRMTGRPGA